MQPGKTITASESSSGLGFTCRIPPGPWPRHCCSHYVNSAPKWHRIASTAISSHSIREPPANHPCTFTYAYYDWVSTHLHACNVFFCACAYVNVHPFICTSVHPSVRPCMHARTHARIHIYLRSHAYIIIHRRTLRTYKHAYAHYITLHCIALHCITLHYFIVHCITWPYNTLHYIAILYFHHITLRYLLYIHYIHYTYIAYITYITYITCITYVTYATHTTYMHTRMYASVNPSIQT